MGKNASGVRGGLQPKDGIMAGEPKGVETLKNIKQPEVYRAVKSAISRYEAVLGVRQKYVKLANLPSGMAGAHYTNTKEGVSTGIYLNKKIFNSKKSEIEAVHKKGYESGWSTKTNKPLTHTVTHEMAHATWNDHLKSAGAKNAGKEIKTVYKQWMKDKSKRGYGQYAKTNVNEFFAETITKGIHGKSDKYTRALIDIVKKHKL